MEFPEELREVWQRRAVEAGFGPGFFVRGYETAVERLEDHRGEVAHDGRARLHVADPAGQNCAVAGEIVYYDGSTSSPDDARKAAFELLALADLAELMAAPTVDSNEDRVAAAVARMKAWSKEHGECDVQGVTDWQWPELARMALGLPATPEDPS